MDYKQFKQILGKRGKRGKTVYVLHKTRCEDCKKFIKNEFHKLGDANEKLTMVKVNMDRPADVADLKTIINVSDSPRFPILVFSEKGFFKHEEKPTMRTIHQRLKDMAKGSGVQRKSLDQIQNILTSSAHKRQRTPLGSSVNIAMDHQFNDELVDLQSVFGNNSVVLFKRNSCGWCRKLQPHFDRLKNLKELTSKVGFYTVDTGNPEHFNASRAMITELSQLHKMPDSLMEFTQNGGVPQLALFTGHSYPHMLAGRNVKALKEEIKQALEKVLVQIDGNSNNRFPFTKLTDGTKPDQKKNSVVLFIDWQHMPCLKAINELHSAAKQLNAAKPTSEKPDVYVFNVRNNMDAWAAFCNKYKIDYNVRLLVETLPQIIYFFKNNRVPRLKTDVDQMSAGDLFRDICKQYRLRGAGTFVENIGMPQYSKKQLMSKFSGGSDAANSPEDSAKEDSPEGAAKGDSIDTLFKELGTSIKTLQNQIKTIQEEINKALAENAGD